MQSGKLRHRVTIEQQVEAQDPETGEMLVTWAPVVERRSAEVLPDRAGEFFAARQIQSTTNAMIRMRYQDGITAKMRVKHHLKDSPAVIQYWNIEGTIHFQDRFRELRLMCLYREAEGFRTQNNVAPPITDNPTADSTLITADSDLYTADAA